jgi:hypothetical membrane protein
MGEIMASNACDITIDGDHGRITIRGSRRAEKAVPGTRQGHHLPPMALVRSYTTMRDTFRSLAISSVVMLPVAILLYGGRFELRSNALSDLGMLATADGEPNTAAFAAFSLYMASAGFFMFVYGRSNRRPAMVPFARLKMVLGYLASAGFLAGILPHDHFHGVHVAGCSVFVGALWCLGNLFSWELLSIGRRRTAVKVQVILQATVLPYAGAYLAGSDARQALQKIAVLGLLVSLYAATRSLRAALVEHALKRPVRNLPGTYS